MLFNKVITCLLFPLISVICLESMIKNSNNYGLYSVSFDYFGTCKGPKSKNLTIMTTELDEQSFAAVINLTFLVDAKIDELKIQVFNVKDNKKIFLWNYKYKDPCRHYSFAAVIKMQLDADECFIKKRNYVCKINFEEVTKSFLSSSFFYGTYSFKTALTSKKGNIACFDTTVVFKKKQ